MKPSSIVSSRVKKANKGRQKHSMTPWRIVSADGYDVLQFRGQFDPKHAPKNTRLIIAAPDLLLSCEMALKLLENPDVNSRERNKVIEQLRASITAATSSVSKSVNVGAANL
ncbi:hypothetical protein KDJ56_22075 (plasmid) [Brevibacillus composti]|uniref:Uncharacterized protein n=1 Tax=Brevibacillus composti TaxID=2796470 RepID=A0A7T5EQB8_9BACL|nr:hypothetical protein [Brevibacillus composti]QQE76765.1 hypothetical protein JD108_22135 [Brevibacillus composti]QUO43829.1 hypothetical protein KDJ56_22075 [Brevibacillus composti]